MKNFFIKYDFHFIDLKIPYVIEKFQLHTIFCTLRNRHFNPNK